MSASYTSGKFSHDPEPWRSRKTGARYVVVDAAPEAVKTWGMDYAPRPEYDNHNPILAAFRRREHPKNIYAVRQWVNFLTYWDHTICPATPQQITRARRVLTRRLRRMENA